MLHRRTALRLTLLLFAAATVVGCTPTGTYPPIEGAAGINNPELNPIPEVMARGIKRVYELDGGTGPIVFNLPEGAPKRLYSRVGSWLGEDSRPMTAGDTRAYHVMQVRVRGFEAEVDVIHTRPDGVAEEVTVRCKNSLAGFTPRSEERWKYRVELPPAHYVADEAAPRDDDGDRQASVPEDDGS